MLGDFKIKKKCKVTNARVSEFELNDVKLELPIFMPVGTYGALKGVCSADIKESMILANTYHLRDLKKSVKEFMSYNRGMLTDSGGFQIGSLPDVSVSEDGVFFAEKLFTPEDSMEIQRELGADIIMQLDDVVNPCDERNKIEVSMRRSIRWLDRCIKTVNSGTNIRIQGKKRTKLEDAPHIEINEHSKQILFPIVQGGLHEDLRQESINEILKRSPKGIAIGGLSGGEEKTEFARIIDYCIRNLPEHMPRYLMGVGYPEDIVVSVALGSDMSDCVYPTRTARFGRAFSDTGDVCFSSKFVLDTRKIDDDCECFTCSKYSRAFLWSIKGTTNFCMLLTAHNLHYMKNLTRRIREAIHDDCYPEFIKSFMLKKFEVVPEWIKAALKMVSVDIA
ncbi:queuine tRNA-ribosyltransferase [Ordospora colligata]|uniref:Queuine tRNA-ribosyltransferase n=1 Tax=Ordospora colligata OC4 TaxID=1354746 RepID=A0A0B2UJV3_9MICR|nr:queuine tRNA-ribosyltransferase [Ordospora colligata OC4]KHN69534.1 queuine tRNA-ribosyltransferase [Ordospora colligata OC4]TBU15354.1 queuine tRNA-ribosyltransferase [Ordospora colligata]TBU15454.1 queuine tRNA-ribosyltransferase [Ordospora colligata]TBU18550.1 queuine tRNA-ribosyltransferase [Ordospora colligata]